MEDRACPASQLVKYCGRHSVEGLRCVDLCCGNGASSIFLAKAGAAVVVGLDKDKASIDEARRKAEAAGVSEKCTFRLVDLLVEKDFFCEDLKNHEEYDLVFDYRGFQELCSDSDTEKAGSIVSQLCKLGGRFLTVSGNAHELRSYPSGSSALSLPELIGGLSPPFSLASLAETRFHDETMTIPPLAWRAVFVKKQQYSNESSVHQFRGDSSTPRSFNSWNKKMYDDNLHSLAKPVRNNSTKRKISNDGPPEIFARKLTTQLTDLNEDAVDAALSVDGSVVPSECGSDYRGSDGFENIKLSRERAANEERARLAGDVPWVRFWEKRAKAYQALAAAQPVVRKLADRVARMALYSSRPQYGLHADDFWSATEVDDDSILFGSEDTAKKKNLYATDLAAGAGACAWALASLVYKGYGAAVHIDLVEPAPSMAALARAQASKLATFSHQKSRATVWQVPVERCHERVSSTDSRSQKKDIMTCSNAMSALNYFDVLEAAAAMLRPGGALAFDLKADDYEETVEDAEDAADAWVPCVLAALRDRGVEATKAQVLSQQHQPAKVRPPLSASSVAAASAAAGLRLASVDLNKDVVPADYFIAQRAISQSWLTEPFSDMPPHDAIQLRNVVVLDAANRAARVSAVLTTVIIVVLKPISPADLISINNITTEKYTPQQDTATSLPSPPASHSNKDTEHQAEASHDRGCRPMDSALKDNHFAFSSVPATTPVLSTPALSPEKPTVVTIPTEEEEETTTNTRIRAQSDNEEVFI